MPIEIRLATRSDVPGVEALAQRLLPDAEDVLDLHGLFDLPAEVLKLHVLLVAADGDAVIGYAFFTPHVDTTLGLADVHTAVLQHICVAEEYRKHKVATALEQEGSGLARDAGYHRAVAKTTKDGTGLLRSLGWDVREEGALAWPSPVPGQKFTFRDSNRPVAVKSFG